MNVKLLVILGKTVKRQVAIRLPAVVGRSRNADVTVTHPLISRRHCEISEDHGLLMLRDLASLNGTMIGGRAIVQAPLLPDAEFTIGPLTFRVLYKYDGDLESVPAIRFVDGVEATSEAGIGDMASAAEELPIPAVDLALPPKPANRSESSEIEIPNFMDLADADPEAVIPDLPERPQVPAALGNGSRRPPTASGPPPTVQLGAIDEPLEVDSSLQSGSHHKESPWAIESPLVEKLRQMPLTSPSKEPSARPETPPDAISDEPDAALAEAPSQRPPRVKPPAPSPKKASYGEEIDPEFGSFLEGLE